MFNDSNFQLMNNSALKIMRKHQRLTRIDLKLTAHQLDAITSGIHYGCITKQTTR